MFAQTKRLVLWHVPDEGDSPVRLASLRFQRQGRSPYQPLRVFIDTIPGSPFEVICTYDTKYKRVDIVVQQDGLKACSVSAGGRSATRVGVRLPSGQFVEIYFNWPKMR